MIHSGWLQEWRAFVQDKGPRPGPISNEHLFEADGRTLLADLKRGEHYRALHGMVWNALHEIYGGGPLIERAALDIYAPPMKTRRASSRKQTEDDAAAAANEAQQQQETQAEEQQEQEPEADAEESPQAMQEDTPQPEQQEPNA
jgi:hypothetical protein